MSFIQARWFHQGRTKTIRLIVVHCTVSPEMGTGAEAVGNYFRTVPRKASAHKVVDNDSVVTCVADEDTAFGAAGANSDGLHLELVGLPSQTRDEWLDAYSTNELALAQTVVREWSVFYDIPLRWLTVAEVADGKTRGITTHADVSAAFPKVSTGHWDPGPNFPRDIFPATPPGDDDLTDDEHANLYDMRKDLTQAIKELRDAQTDITSLHIKDDQIIAKLDELLAKD